MSDLRQAKYDSAIDQMAVIGDQTVSCQVQGKLLLVHFSRDVYSDVTSNLMLRVNGATHILSHHAAVYDASSRVATIRGLPMRRGDRISVTITGLADIAADIPGESVTCSTSVSSRW